MRLEDSAPPGAMAARRLLLALFDAALKRVDGRTCVREFLQHHAATQQANKVAVAAVGKAASAMALGAFDVCGARVTRLLCITKDGHVDQELRQASAAHVFESSHPVPDERSLVAGAELAGWAGGLAADEWPVLLVSGGASSLAEHLQPGATLADLQALNKRGLAAGWSIGELNAARCSLSQIKGGGITRLLGGRSALALFVSDVPGDDPSVIGSGLLGPDGAAHDRVERHVVASIETALTAIASAAEAHGYACTLGARRFDSEAASVALEFVRELAASSREVIAWGGESVVSLPAAPGRGGRNQHAALAAALSLKGLPRMAILAAGTDGTDGVTQDAGAIVDSETCTRIELAGFDPGAALAAADAGTVLEAAGDLVHTGPTGTNVCDLLIGVRYDAAFADRVG
jgi:glycerate 2-kinase